MNSKLIKPIDATSSANSRGTASGRGAHGREQPNYYAVIPACVRYSAKLTPNMKLLYGEIAALASATGKCWASNRYFSELYAVTRASISSWISKLCDEGFISSQLVYEDGTKHVKERILTVLPTCSDKSEYPYSDFLEGGIQEKPKANSPRQNNPRGNTGEIDQSGSGDEGERPHPSQPTRAAVEAWWNKVAGAHDLSKIRAMTATRWRKFAIRLNEGLWDAKDEIEERVSESTFLRGGKWFGFDWLVANDTNWRKIVEGSYAQNTTSRRESWSDLGTGGL